MFKAMFMASTIQPEVKSETEHLWNKDVAFVNLV